MKTPKRSVPLEEVPMPPIRVSGSGLEGYSHLASFTPLQNVVKISRPLWGVGGGHYLPGMLS